MDLERFKQLHAYFSQQDLPEGARETEEYEAYTDAIHENEECYNWATAEKLKSKGFDYESYCCLMMADNVYSSLDDAGEIRYGDPSVIINKWDEGLYGIPIHDGGSSMVLIHYCPWCGKKIAE
ncbi:hypothetical protein [Pontibacter sp. SGAir0037]|uniref:DUF6980 family protein n=1 Tax=Pontibacter sp. SGAir0037 TaxID=2571030 RepID=UPI0010CCF51D|nr:hypothetical protein [Pontibacter sp. SGAir0037]QCR24385.1 hypothetical protein C1N53_19820 [Pontibacter sp. SGAir0037]